MSRSRSLPAHGTRSRYSAHCCRCRSCRAAHSEYERNRSRQKAYGTWEPYVDADPVRAHVRGLMAKGLGWRRIADLAGLPRATMNRLLYGQPGKRSPSSRVRKNTANRLLAVRFSQELLADCALTDATGTWRRIQALVAIGWPKVHIARALGYKGQGLQLHEDLVLVSTARKVAELYEALWSADPVAHGVSARQAARARHHAADRGWAPPMAWDDDAIDDPDSTPHADEQRPNDKRPAADRMEDIEHLAAFDTPLDEIASRVGVSTNYVQSLLRRSNTPCRQGTGG